MDEIGRRRIPHDPPFGIGVGGELFFLTIVAKPPPLLTEADFPFRLLESINHLHARGIWFTKVAMVMPDHVHLLVRIPAEGSLRRCIGSWKRWTSGHIGVHWQRDFFDHRLRHSESENEKADYILMNPVRAGLCQSPDDWPHRWICRD